MSEDTIIKFFALCIFSIMLSYVVFSRFDEEVGEEKVDHKRRYLPYISSTVLPIAIVVILLMTYFIDGLNETVRTLISVYFNLIVHISVFYTFLILVLPLLRQFMSARSIAFLWMIPNLLYLMLYKTMTSTKPLFVIRIPEKWLFIIFIIISIGAIAVFVTKVISHFKFRHYILKDATPIDNEDILEIWNNEIKLADLKKLKVKLVTSHQVSTPLSIGLTRKTTCVVLPDKYYSKKELSLIFRHEIIHICREDAWSKLFLMICSALCWYNPLMWIASRKCSDDLELSCDETVLINMDETSRKTYANLILKTAGDERGFTTCLSANANALRYRLSNIMKPRRRRSGAIIVGIVFLTLSMSFSAIALAYEEHTGKEVIFEAQDPASFNIRSIRLEVDDYNTIIRCVDENIFHKYLSDLKMSSITGRYTFDTDDKKYIFVYETPQGTMGLVVSENVIKVAPLYGSNPEASYYYLNQKIDWNDFETMIVSYPALNVDLYDDDNYYRNYSAALIKLSQDDEVIYDISNQENIDGGIVTSLSYKKAKLSFSYDQVVDYRIVVESYDKNESYVINKTDVNENGEFVLPIPYANYTIYATLKDKQANIVETEYRFFITNQHEEMEE